MRSSRVREDARALRSRRKLSRTLYLAVTAVLFLVCVLTLSRIIQWHFTTLDVHDLPRGGAAAMSAIPVPKDNMEEVARLTAPIFAMPRLCNERNTQPLTPRPAEYDPSIINVVVGIMTLDDDGHASLRTAQRDSWFHYRDVARPANGFRGRLYVEYFFGRSFYNNYTFTDALHRESAEHADILVMDINEPKRIPKALLTTGKYGVAAEVTMGFKALAFYCYAERVYDHAKFVVKADDDEFIRVPVVMRTVDSMPSYGVFWTTRTRTRWGKRKGCWLFCGASGMWVAMTRDVLHMLNSIDEIQQYGAGNLTSTGVVGPRGNVVAYRWLYRNTPFHAEDVIPAGMIAHVTRRSDILQRIGLNYTFHYYSDPRCRMHNHNNEVSSKSFIYFVNPMSMIIHHATYAEQQQYMGFFPEGNLYDIQFRSGGLYGCHGTPFMLSHLCRKPESKIRL